MRITTGYYASENGSKYLQQLCKHFQHKITVRFDAEEGRFAAETGTAHLRADAKGLTVQLTAEDAKGLIDLRYMIDKHLVNFAWREGFTGCAWRMEDDGGAPPA